MKKSLKFILIKAIALAILFSLYSLTKLPSLSDNEKKQLAGNFSFEQKSLFEPADKEAKFVRNVHPQYQNISSWISSVGAAVTLTDIDGNGLSNDIIHVDPRYDAVIISPAPGTNALYSSFILKPQQLTYDSMTTAPMGTLAYDFNNDGSTDILTYYWGRSPIIFYQTGTGFIEKELKRGIERWFTNSALLADFDGDGHIDILISNYFPDGARVLDANAGDADQVMQHSMSRAYNGGDDHFFLYTELQNGFPTFTEHTEWRNDVDHPRDWTLAIAAADLDGDQLPEIYFANDFGPDKLLYNLSTPGNLHFKQLYGTRRFTDVRSAVLGRDSFKGMGACFADVNGDGLLDIYVSNIAADYALQESHFVFINTGKMEQMKNGIAPFVNKSEALGLSRSSWAWDCRFADFNNDGTYEALQATGFVRGTKNKWAELQELAIGNDEMLVKPAMWPSFKPGTDLSGHDHNYLFAKSDDGRFYDISMQLSVNFSHITRGLALGDVEHDGDIDIITANQWEPSYAYINTYTGNNSFLGLRIMQRSGKTVKFAVGASVKLILPEKIVPSFVDGGNGHSGKNSNEVFFGLGNMFHGQPFPVEIQYRSETGTILKKIFKLFPGWHTLLLPG